MSAFKGFILVLCLISINIAKAEHMKAAGITDEQDQTRDIIEADAKMKATLAKFQNCIVVDYENGGTKQNKGHPVSLRSVIYGCDGDISIKATALISSFGESDGVEINVNKGL